MHSQSQKANELLRAIKWARRVRWTKVGCEGAVGSTESAFEADDQLPTEAQGGAGTISAQLSLLI